MLRTYFNLSFEFLKKSSKKIIFGAFFLILFSFLIKQSFAQNFISTSDAINEIERALSTPKGSEVLNRKSQNIIDRRKVINETNNQDQTTSQIDIKVIKRRDDQANRLKEKLAYNATISGQYEVAAELYKQILQTENNNNYVKFALAINYHKLKQYQQAKEIYYELLGNEIDNKDEVISNFLEILVEESPKDAKYVLARLSAQSPNSDYILARSALTYNKINQKDEAIILLKRAIAINPKNADYQLNLAIILDKNNESLEALKYYKKVLRHYISSGDISAQANVSDIRKRINFIEQNNS